MLRVKALLVLFFCSLIWQECINISAHSCYHHDENGGEEPCESSSQGKNKGRKETLVFGGSVERTSVPLPEDATKQQVSSFLRDERRSNLVSVIASAGGARSTREVARTDELDGLWRDCCLDTYGSENLPAPDDPVFVTNTTSRFPGLKLTTTVYNGIKTFETEAGIPQYVLNMIAETQTPTGFPPVVWAFHKIMGFCEPQGSLRPCGRVQSVLSVVEDSNDSRRLAFHMDVSVRIKVEFPAVLMRILPMKKDKAEAVASSSILKSVSRDVKTVVAGMQKAFVKWHSAVEGVAAAARRIPEDEL